MSARTDEIGLAMFDSDSGFLRVVSKRAGELGWRYHRFGTAPTAEALARRRMNALVLDVASLGQELTAYLERLRAAAPEVVIVVCAGRSTLGQRVGGLRAGADYWLTKPCHPLEVLARVESALRRQTAASAPRAGREPFVAGELEIRPDRYEAVARCRSAGLTRREFELLELLALGSGRVLQREEIYSAVWGYSLPRGDRSVDVFVRKLRQKLVQVSPNWRYIHTHFGVGYRFEPQAVGHAGQPRAGDEGRGADDRRPRLPVLHTSLRAA